jgi:putative endonuclease
MSAVSRAEAAERGRRAEQAVADHLVRSGYAVIGRNVRVGHLEVDIIARKGSVVCVVEVRHRSPNSWQTPFESIGEVKQRRLRRAAERLWRERYARDCSVDRIRFDIAAVAFVDGQSVIDYVEGGM